MDDFHKRFDRTRRTVRALWFFTLALWLVGVGFIIWAGVQVAQAGPEGIGAFFAKIQNGYHQESHP